MQTTQTLVGILSRRLDQPEPFEVYVDLLGPSYYQGGLKAVHVDCIEYADGSLIPLHQIKFLRIVEIQT